MAPAFAAVPKLISWVALGVFVATFGGRFLWWPYKQVSKFTNAAAAADSGLRALKIQCVGLIQRCKEPDWLREKSQLTEDMKAYFSSAQEFAFGLGELEGMILFDETDIDPAKFAPPQRLGGWVKDNYPKLVVSSIHLDEFTAARRT